MTTYGNCVGVPGYQGPHIFYDGHNHFRNSQGLCPACKELTMRIFRQQMGSEKVELANSPSSLRN